MLKIALVFSMLVAVGFSRLRPCNHPGGLNTPAPLSVNIPGCPNDAATRCRIIRGTDILGTFGFRSTHDATSLRPQVHGTAFGVRVEYELPADRQIGCNWLAPGSRCPLSVGETAFYNLSMPITEEYPIVQVDIEIRLFNNLNTIQFCALIEGEVVLN